MNPVWNTTDSQPAEYRKLVKGIPEDIMALFEEEGVIVAGGAVTSVFTGRDINDIDVYFRSKESLKRAVKSIYGTVETESGIDIGAYQLICCNYTDKSMLFKDRHGDVHIQFIYFDYFTSPYKLFETFDFTVCMGAYDFKFGGWCFHEDFFKHNAQRYLSYNAGTRYPLLSALRVDKYKEKGYTISKKEYLRVILSAMNLEIDSWGELKEHVGGFYGMDVDDLFDVKEEFTVERALSHLANTDRQIKGTGTKDVSLFDLLMAIDGGLPADTVFFKTVKKIGEGDFQSLFGRLGQTIYYVPGSVVNGGENGVFCVSNVQRDDYNMGPGIEERAVAELKPLSNEKPRVNEREVQLFGDVEVVALYTEQEWEERKKEIFGGHDGSC